MCRILLISVQLIKDLIQNDFSPFNSKKHGKLCKIPNFARKMGGNKFDRPNSFFVDPFAHNYLLTQYIPSISADSFVFPQRHKALYLSPWYLTSTVLWRVLGPPLQPITMLFKGQMKFDSYKIWIVVIFAPLWTLSANSIEIEQLLYE